MKRKSLLLLFFFTCFCYIQAGYAQRGDIALGIRATPDGGGLSSKYFFDRNLAFEGQVNAGGIIGLEGKSFNMAGLMEYHISLPDPSWRLFLGGGMHLGTWNRGNRYSERAGRYVNGSEFILGIDAIGGVEYLFKKIPLGLSADFKPAVNFLSEIDFFPHNMFGASARFYITR